MKNKIIPYLKYCWICGNKTIRINTKIDFVTKDFSCTDCNSLLFSIVIKYTNNSLYLIDINYDCYTICNGILYNPHPYSSNRFDNPIKKCTAYEAIKEIHDNYKKYQRNLIFE